MTAAHLPGAILTPRYRGARAVASFNAAERHGARNQIQRIAGRTANPVGQLSGRANAAHGFCLAVGSAALFNAVSNERSPEPGRCLVSSEAPGCRGDAYTQPSPCEMTTHCMAKANAGAGGRHGCTHHSDRKRRR